jgi:hypothetical protein
MTADTGLHSSTERYVRTLLLEYSDLFSGCLQLLDNALQRDSHYGVPLFTP